MARKSLSTKNLRGKMDAAKSVAKGSTPKQQSTKKGGKLDKTARPSKEAADVASKKEGKKTAAKEKVVAAPKEAPKKRRSKSGIVRLKAYWGVFNQMMKRVAVYEYSERRQADKKAGELSGSSKAPHFVQLVKEVIRDAD